MQLSFPKGIFYFEFQKNHSARMQVTISSIYIQIHILLYCLRKMLCFFPPLNKCIFSCVYRRIEEHLVRKKGRVLKGKRDFLT